MTLSRSRSLATGALSAVLITTAGCGFSRTGRAAGDGGSGRVTDSGGHSDGSPAQDAAESDGGTSDLANVYCAHTDDPPLMDGVADGPWSTAHFIDFAASDAELAASVQHNYGYDASVSFSCLNDQDNIYFYFDVTDDLVVQDSLSMKQDDGVVLFLDGDGDRSGTYSGSDHALMLGAEGGSLDYGPGTLVPDGVVSATSKGYAIEISMARTDVGPIPTDGIIGFNLAIIDDDGLGNGDRDIFALRYVPDPPACETCCSGDAQPWCDTSVSGTLTLQQ